MHVLENKYPIPMLNLHHSVQVSPIFILRCCSLTVTMYHCHASSTTYKVLTNNDSVSFTRVLLYCTIYLVTLSLYCTLCYYNIIPTGSGISAASDLFKIGSARAEVVQALNTDY